MAHMRPFVGPGREKNISHSITGGEFVNAGRKTSGHHNSSNLNANYYLSSGNLTWASEVKVDALGHPISMTFAVNPRKGTDSCDPVTAPNPHPFESNHRLFDRHFYETAYNAAFSPGYKRGESARLLNPNQRPVTVPTRSTSTLPNVPRPSESRPKSSLYQPRTSGSVFKVNPWRRFTTSHPSAPAYTSSLNKFRATRVAMPPPPQPDVMAASRPSLDTARLFDNQDTSGKVYSQVAGQPSFFSRPTGKLFMEDADTGIALGIRDSKYNPITGSVKPVFGARPLSHNFRAYLASDKSEVGLPGYTGHRPRMRYMCGTRTD